MTIESFLGMVVLAVVMLAFVLVAAIMADKK
jgi:hypothetical protein